MPAERDHDRTILQELQSAQYALRRAHVRMSVKKILFDIETEHGSARPDFLIAVKDTQTQQQVVFALQVLQSNDPGYLELRAIEYERLREIGPVFALPIPEVTAKAITERALSVIG